MIPVNLPLVDGREKELLIECIESGWISEGPYVKKFEENFSNFSKLSSLNKIIQNNELLRNRFGDVCYLREFKNNYFLVNSILESNDFFNMYYNQNIYLEIDNLSENTKCNIYY